MFSGKSPGFPHPAMRGITRAYALGGVGIAAALVFLAVACVAGEGEGRMESVFDLTGRRLGTLSGTTFDRAANMALDFTQIEYFDDVGSMFAALRAKEIDAVLCDSPVANYLAESEPDLRRLRGVLKIENFALALRRDDKELYDQINRALREFIADGTVDRLVAKWIDGPPEGRNMSGVPSPELGGRVVRFGICAYQPPFAYRDGRGQFQGFDVELAMLLAERIGARLEIVDVEFTALISSLFYGRFDFIGSCISVDSERGNLVQFTDSYYTSGVTALVLSD